MLSFTTTSLFFGGLAAAAVPILLHLLMQGKPKEIEFPAVMFLVKKIETHRRNYQLKHIVLLVMRILLFTLLGLALAKPMLKLSWGLPFRTFFSQSQEKFVSNLVASIGSQDAPIAAAIVIDTSLRMNYMAENNTRLETAQKFAQWILRQLPQNSNIAVLNCDPETAVFQVDKLEAEEKINRLCITPLGRPVAEVVQNAAALLQGSDFERELYVLSDLSVPGWDIPISSDVLRQYNGGIFLVDVSVKEPKNSAIRQFSFIPETPMARAPFRIDVQTAHFGPAVTKTIELIFIGTSKDPTAETVRMSRNVDFPDGESQRSVPMLLTSIDPGTYQGKIRFSDNDALPMDDQCWFTLSVQPPQKILIFAQPPVRDSAIYLRQALETVPFAIETAPISELSGMTKAELQTYQAVVLLDPPSLLPVTWKKLTDYVTDGYGVGIFLGSNAKSLPAFNDPKATEVLGAKLVRQALSSEEELWILPGISPIFAPFRSIPQYNTLDQFPWHVQPIFRYWELGDLSPHVDIAARFSDTRPAIITQTLGRGRTVLVTTPISETANTLMPWNDLPRSEAPWMFMLLAEGIGKYLVGMGNQKFNFNIGEPVVLRPTLTTLPSSCLLGTPLGKSVPLTLDPSSREIVISTTTEPGNYSIHSRAGQAPLDMRFSANIPAGVTMLQSVDKTVLDRHFGVGNYQVVRTPQEIELGIARRRVGQDMYAVIMLLLACIFATEYVFANRIYGNK